MYCITHHSSRVVYNKWSFLKYDKNSRSEILDTRNVCLQYLINATCAYMEMKYDMNWNGIIGTDTHTHTHTHTLTVLSGVT